MSFVRFEDRMPEHPKFIGIPSAAGWLHVQAMLYASRALTDGFVPVGKVHKLTEDPPVVVNRAIEWLTTPRPGCMNPLWHAVEGGWSVHDYADEEFGNATRAGAEKAREQARRAGKASAEAREQRYGTAQPNSKLRTDAERPVRERSERPVRTGPEQAVGTAPEPRPVPSRTTPPLRASHAAPVPVPAPAREADPDDEPELPVEVLARMDLLVEAFDGHDGLLKRPLRADERPVLLGWGHLERAGQLVPLDEIVTFAQRLLATPFRDSTLPATLRAIDATVLTLARAPAPNGVNGTGPAGERLTPNSQLARQIEAQMRERQGGQAT